MFVINRHFFQFRIVSDWNMGPLSIILLYPEKKLSCLNQERNKHRSSENSLKQFQTNMLVDFDVRGQQRMDLFTGGSITDLYLSRSNSFNLKCFNDGFVSYKRIFLLQRTSIDELKLDYLWIIVIFLSVVWTLILTAPIHWRGCIVEQGM